MSNLELRIIEVQISATQNKSRQWMQQYTKCIEHLSNIDIHNSRIFRGEQYRDLSKWLCSQRYKLKCQKFAQKYPRRVQLLQVLFDKFPRKKQNGIKLLLRAANIVEQRYIAESVIQQQAIQKQFSKIIHTAVSTRYISVNFNDLQYKPIQFDACIFDLLQNNIANLQHHVRVCAQRIHKPGCLFVVGGSRNALFKIAKILHSMQFDWKIIHEENPTIVMSGPL